MSNSECGKFTRRSETSMGSTANISLSCKTKIRITRRLVIGHSIIVWDTKSTAPRLNLVHSMGSWEETTTFSVNRVTTNTILVMNQIILKEPMLIEDLFLVRASWIKFQMSMPMTLISIGQYKLLCKISIHLLKSQISKNNKIKIMIMMSWILC